MFSLGGAMTSGSKDQLIHRAAIIEGHVRAVKRLFEEDRPVLEILTQLSAVRSSLNRLQHVLFEEYVEELLMHLDTTEQRSGAVADIRAAMEMLS
jgi:DNA-binding FrmR family transcriptional regulator